MTPDRRTTGAAPRVATVVAALVLALVGATRGAPATSLASLTASMASDSATVTAGTATIALSGGAATGSWMGSVTLVPGQTKYYPITVTNSGSSRLQYSVTATTTSDANGFAAKLQVALTAGVTACDVSTGPTGGTSVATGKAFGSSGGTALVTSRAIATSAAETLCLGVAFPYGTGVGFAGRSFAATTTFTFAGSQY